MEPDEKGRVRRSALADETSGRGSESIGKCKECTGGAEAGWVGEVGAATGSMLNAGTRFCAERGLIIIGTASPSSTGSTAGGISSCSDRRGSAACAVCMAGAAAVDRSFLTCFLSPALTWLLLASGVCTWGELLPLRLVWPFGSTGDGGEVECM